MKRIMLLLILLFLSGCSYSYRNETLKRVAIKPPENKKYTITVIFQKIDFHEDEISGIEIAMRLMTVKKSIQETGIFKQVTVIFDHYTEGTHALPSGSDFLMIIKSSDQLQTRHTFLQVLSCVTLFIFPDRGREESRFFATVKSNNPQKERLYSYTASSTYWTSLFFMFAAPFMKSEKLKNLARYDDAGRYFIQKMSSDGYFE